MATTKAPAKKAAKKTSPKAEKPATEPKAAPKRAKKENDGTFAVFATGGKQYLVSPGEKLKIEILKGEYKEGDTLSFDNVLLSGSASDAKLGDPFIKGGAVTATLVKIGRHKKVDVVKYKQKSRYFKKNGHRQPYFEIEIDSIK